MGELTRESYPAPDHRPDAIDYMLAGAALFLWIGSGRATEDIAAAVADADRMLGAIIDEHPEALAILDDSDVRRAALESVARRRAS